LKAPSLALRALPLVAVLVLGVACGDPLADTRDVPVNIPWKGLGAETATYAIKRLDGSGTARGTLTVEELGDQTAFRQTYEDETGVDKIEVIADATTLRPKTSTREIRSETLTRDVRAEYGNDEVRVLISGQDPADETLEFPAHAYDAEQSLFLWRTMPFTVGYEVKYVTINVYRPTARVVTARVVAVEDVTIDAGTFNAYRIEISAANEKLIAWYETGNTNRLVKYDTGEFIYELLP